MGGSVEKLANRVALVTGGASGIGQATAVLFAGAGARVLVADVDATGGEDTVKKIRAAGGEACFVVADVSEPSDVQKMVKAADETFGRLDVLVNAAGVAGQFARAAELDVAEWDRVMSINLRGVFLACKYAIPIMQEQGGGTIVNIASSAAITPTPYVSVYAAAKAGVMQLSKALAVEYGTDNIRVNSICPGFIETAMTAPIIPKDPDSRKGYADFWPLGGVGQAEDVARAALYLACDDSSFVTGTNLLVDGGWLASNRLPIVMEG